MPRRKNRPLTVDEKAQLVQYVKENWKEYPDSKSCFLCKKMVDSSVSIANMFLTAKEAQDDHSCDG